MLQLRARTTSSSSSTLKTLLHTSLPSSSRPTKLQAPVTPRRKAFVVPNSLSTPGTDSRFSSRYGFTRIRLSIAQSTAKALYRVQKLYKRLPQPIRYTLSFISLLGIALALILPPTMVFRNHFYDIIRITGPSMSPYLNTDFEDGGGAATDLHDITKSSDRIMLNLYEPRKNLRQGMVVAFRTPHDPERWAIKRIVALEGDRVFPLPHYPGYEALEARGLIVPLGHLWVEGDVADSNKKDVSMDSNIYGPISTGLVMGRATHVITSFFRKWIPIDAQHFKLPARVEVDAVTIRNPNLEYQSHKLEETFRNGKAAEILQVLRSRLQDPDIVEKYRSDQDMVQMLHAIGDAAYLQREKEESEVQTRELANSVLTAVIQVLGEKSESPRRKIWNGGEGGGSEVVPLRA